MFTSLILGTALVAPAAPVPSDTNPPPASPAPWVVYLKGDQNGRISLIVFKIQKVKQSKHTVIIENGKRIAKQEESQIDQLTPSDVSLAEANAKFTTVQGVALSPNGVLKRAQGGLVALISADGKPIAKAWSRAFDPDTVVVMADSLVSTIAPRPAIPVLSAAPQLVLLGSGKDGKVQVTYNPNTFGNEQGGEFLINRRGRPLFIKNNGNAIFVNDEEGLFSSNQLSLDTEAPEKPLEDITFEAYDRTGRSIDRELAIKRLEAGGLLLVAGSNRIPDEDYLKIFPNDITVVVSNELLHIPIGKSKSSTTKSRK